MQGASLGMRGRMRPFLLLLALGPLGVATERALPVPARRAETALIIDLGANSRDGAMRRSRSPGPSARSQR